MAQDHPRRRGRLLVVAVAATATLGALVAGTSTAAAGPAATTTIWLPTPVCDAPTPGHAACDALRLVATKVPANSRLALQTPARASQTGPAFAKGPAGGYTPADLARAYGVNAASTAASNKVVAIVDAYNDPSVIRDLDTFDAHYGLPRETSSSFRVVNQRGSSAPLPAGNAGWAGEITLDVQAVRGLCHRCRILLVEASSDAYPSLGTAEDTAARYRWTVGRTRLAITAISNSYGAVETDPELPAGYAAHFNHPGIAILAATGDDGWYEWDAADDGGRSAGRSEVPASFNSVVGVGGTSLSLNANGTRAAERVWNSNGPHNAYGQSAHKSLGAAGSGCSAVTAAHLWQRKVAGYTGLGCGTTRRSEVDIAAVADPSTGYDVYQTHNVLSAGWETVGGTSLSSPIVAAAWALAGGTGGVAYPSLSLYGHYRSTPSALYDIRSGGTGFCDTTAPSACAAAEHGNPNGLGHGAVDCAFPWGGHPTVTGPYQCYARSGYDGASGVGTLRGVSALRAMQPTARISRPAHVRHRHVATFRAVARRDPFPGGSVTSYRWKWGDGHLTTTRRPAVHHTFAHKGRFKVRLVVTDTYGRSSVARVAVIRVR